MMTLTEFLLARIAEDEAAAQETWPNDWICDGNTVTSRDPDPRESYRGDHTQVARLAMTVGRYQREAANAEHIARHDPARVLAVCEAKRRIVRLYLDTTHYEPNDPYDAALLDVMRFLALPYADHPDYRDEWRI